MQRRTAGLVCFVIGGVTWPVGFAMEYEIPQILPVHLFFVFSAIALRGSHLLNAIKKKIFGR